MDELPFELIELIFTFSSSSDDAINLSNTCKYFNIVVKSIIFQKNQSHSEPSKAIKQLQILNNIYCTLCPCFLTLAPKIRWTPMISMNLEFGTDGNDILVKRGKSIFYLNSFQFGFWITNINVDFCDAHDVVIFRFVDASPDDCTRFNLNVKLWPRIRECLSVDHRAKELCFICESLGNEQYFKYRDQSRTS